MGKEIELKIKDDFIIFKNKDAYERVMKSEYVEKLLRNGRLYATKPSIITRVDDYFMVKSSDAVGIVKEFTEDAATVRFFTDDLANIYQNAYLKRRIVGKSGDIARVTSKFYIIKNGRFVCFDIRTEEEEKNGEERKENV